MSRKDPTVSWHSLPGIMFRGKQLDTAELWHKAKCCQCRAAFLSVDWFPWFLSFDYSSETLL